MVQFDAMGESQEFCLRWSSYQDQLGEALRSLLDKELLVDVTLACDGRSLRAHRAILSACSTYFQELFEQSIHPHPIVILKDVRFDELQALVKFMYHGEVTMNNDSLPGFLKTAETLHIRGLTNRIPPVEELITMRMMRIDAEESSGIEQEADQCNLKSNDLQMTSSDSFSVSDRDSTHKTITTLDGLSQLVLPVLQEDSRSSSQFSVNQGFLSQQQQNVNNHALSSRPFRHRVLWNHDQLLQLESWYRSDRYPTGQAMRHYADTLAAMCPTGASPTRQNVDYWFQNRRRKDSHPEVLQQREKKKLAKTLWGNILDQRAGHSSS
ncbi:hypothetical protein L9F63_014703 [Diploptera punctata]|uniref:Uncharacterized protein n=1 Tax=Diploptera punctata TaxID=6984 RepID=A0AAD8A7R4_DIPPU|nr:hypothetical protein L9F63_014703 [Diploptera punctata]